MPLRKNPLTLRPLGYKSAISFGKHLLENKISLLSILIHQNHLEKYFPNFKLESTETTIMCLSGMRLHLELASDLGTIVHKVLHSK